MFLPSVTAPDTDGVRSPTWISTSLFPVPNYYQQMYYQILQKNNWKNVFVVTDGTTTTFYSYVSDVILPFLNTAPNLQADSVSYSTVAETFDARSIIDRFQTVSRGTGLSAYVSQVIVQFERWIGLYLYSQL